MSTAPETRAEPQSSTIGGLPTPNAQVMSKILEFLIPIAFNGDNYRITPKQFLKKEYITDLDKVDNTPDSGKPVSTPQQEALDQKADKTDLQNYVHKDAGVKMENVTGLTEALANKIEKGEHIPMEDVEGLMLALENLAEKDHTHKLTDLTGWNAFVQQLQQDLAARPTEEELGPLVETKVQETLETTGVLNAVIYDPAKSTW